MKDIAKTQLYNYLHDSLSHAISLINPSDAEDTNKDEKLSPKKITEAHDILLDCARALQNMTIPEVEKQEELDSKDSTTTKESSRSIEDIMELSLDIYRCLLVTCFILPEIIPARTKNKRESIISIDNTNDYYLNSQDMTRIQKSINQCIYILYISSFRYRDFTSSQDQYNQQQRQIDNNNDNPTNWHDEYLPPSKFSFLKSCFHGENPLVNLDLDYCLSGEEEEIDDDIMNDNNYEYENNCEDENIIFLGNDFTEREALLREEEAILLQVAIPNNTSKSGKSNTSTKQKKSFQHKCKNNKFDYMLYSSTLFKETPMIFTVVQEGWLVLKEEESPKLLNEEHTQQQQQQQPPSAPRRVFCKLYHNGIFCIFSENGYFSKDVQTNNQPSDTSLPEMYGIIPNKTTCNPIIKGYSRFHFLIENVQNLHYHHHCYSNDSNSSSSSPKLHNLFFLIDDDGGGLMEGFKWVSSIQSVTQYVLPEYDDIQERLAVDNVLF